MKFGVAVTLRATLQLGQSQGAQEGSRVPLSGTTSEIIDDIRMYEAAGLAYLVLSVAESATSLTIDAVRRFAEEILPRV